MRSLPPRLILAANQRDYARHLRKNARVGSQCFIASKSLLIFAYNTKRMLHFSMIMSTISSRRKQARRKDTSLSPSADRMRACVEKGAGKGSRVGSLPLLFLTPLRYWIYNSDKQSQHEER
jgi:hypothetical protein